MILDTKGLIHMKAFRPLTGWGSKALVPIFYYHCCSHQEKSNLFKKSQLGDIVIAVVGKTLK